LLGRLVCWLIVKLPKLRNRFELSFVFVIVKILQDFQVGSPSCQNR
jgi:hypothetical protein